MSSGGFGRILAALPTPLDERGALDLQALDHLVRYFAERNLDGFVIGTEAGEGPYLEPDELRSLIERVSRELQGRKPFWVELTAASTRGAVEVAAFAADQGAEGLLLSYPRLPGVGYAELYRHLDRLGQATTTPWLLVARPGDLVSSLAPEEQATLAKHERLAGVFLAEGAVASQARPWAKRFEGRGDVFGACAFEVAEAAKGGCSGFICALSLLAPEPSRALVDAYGRGALDTVRPLSKRMASAVERLGPPRLEGRGGVERLAERIARRPLDGGRLRPWASPGLLKLGLSLQGHRVRAFVRPPQPQVTDAERERLRSLMRACGMLG
ncbi:MAG: dihydrodipicolinate synthase family protein [Myxococcota bacterium]